MAPVLDLSVPSEIKVPPPPFDAGLAHGYAIVYCRISGSDDVRTASLATQAAAAIAKAYAEGYLVRPEDIYLERQSGFQTEHLRPLLNLARERLLRGEAQAIVAYDTDRLARSDDLKSIVRHIERRKARVLFVNFHRVPGVIGDFMLDVKSMASTQEIINIKDRTTRGRDELRAFGKMIGCGPAMYGYRWNKEKRCREEDPETAATVRLIFEWVGDEGMSTIQVARKLTAQGVPCPYMSRPNRQNKFKVCRWNATRIGFIVRERSYLGLTLEGRTRPVLDDLGEPVRRLVSGKLRTVREPVPPEEWTVVPNSLTPRLVDDALWERANRGVDGKSRKRQDGARNAARFFLLRGILYCDNCKRKMTPAICKERAHSRERPVYQCSTRRSAWRHERKCDSPQARAGELEDQVWSMVMDYIDNPEAIAAEFDRAASAGNVDLLRDELAGVERDLKSARKKLGNYNDAFAEADTRELRAAVKDKIAEQKRVVGGYETRAATLQARLAPAGAFEQARRETMELVDRFREAGRLDAFTPSQRRELLDGLGVTVYAYKGRFALKITRRLPGVDVAVLNSSLKRTGENSNAGDVVVTLCPRIGCAATLQV